MQTKLKQDKKENNVCPRRFVVESRISIKREIYKTMLVENAILKTKYKIENKI